MSIRTRFNPLGTIGRKALLPAGYIELEYLESTGTQYIDTGIVPDTSTRWEVRLVCTGKGTSGNFDTYGTRCNVPSNQRFNVQINNIEGSGPSYKSAYGYGANSYWDVQTDAVHTYCIDAENLRYRTDGDQWHPISGNISGIVVPIMLFAMGNTTTAGNVVVNFTVSRCYYSKIWKNNKLVRNFIPALDPAGRPCMFDTVTQQPYYNQGTGEFKFNYQLIDEYLNVDVSGTRVAIPTDITLADSLGFVLTAECIYHGDIDHWTNIMFLGGKSEEGYFGLQHNGTDPNNHWFIYSNNGRSGSNSVNIPVNIPLVCTLDKNGLSVNGTQYGPVATQAYNKTTQVVGQWDKRISVKSWVLTSNNAKIIDVHAVTIRDKKYLYDFANSVIIKVTTP